MISICWTLFLLLFHTRTRNEVRIESNGRYEFLMQRREDSHIKLTLQRLSQCVREESDLKLNLKLSTWIGAFSIYGIEEITNLLSVRLELLRFVGCTWNSDPLCISTWWFSFTEKILEALQLLQSGWSGSMWSAHNSFPQTLVYVQQDEDLSY